MEFLAPRLGLPSTGFWEHLVNVPGGRKMYVYVYLSNEKMDTERKKWYA